MSKKSSSPTNWDLTRLLLKHTRRMLQYGPPGTGKSYIAINDTEFKRPIYSVTITPEMPAAELRGHYVPQGNEFVWKDGPAILAWKQGGRLVINEIDHASGDVLSFLHVILDDKASAVLTLPTGETIRPADGFQCVATMNGVPDDLPEALRSRFPVAIEVTEPNPHAIAALPDDLQNAAKGSCVHPDHKLRINLRSWFEFAHLRTAIGAENAAIAVFGVRAKDIVASLAIASAPASA